MQQNLKKVEIDTIDEGRFKASIDEGLDTLQEAIIKHCDKYGISAKGAKAKLTVEVMIGCISPEDGAFAFSTQIKQTLPPPPAKITMAMAGIDSNNHPALFARASGTGKDAPIQGILCTETGVTVDPETGEVLTTTESVKK